MFLTRLLSIVILSVAGLAASEVSPDPPRPRLQIINGSHQPVDVFWLKSATERIPNGTVAPGENTVIATTLGHRFAVVSKDGN